MKVPLWEFRGADYCLNYVNQTLSKIIEVCKLFSLVLNFFPSTYTSGEVPKFLTTAHADTTNHSTSSYS